MQLTLWLDAAAGGAGSIALVCGEAGIGAAIDRNSTCWDIRSPRDRVGTTRVEVG